MASKEWTEPALIILGRGRPEEHVLEVCKNHVQGGMDRSPCHSPNPAENKKGQIGKSVAGGHPCRGVSGS